MSDVKRKKTKNRDQKRKRRNWSPPDGYKRMYLVPRGTKDKYEEWENE